MTDQDSKDDSNSGESVAAAQDISRNGSDVLSNLDEVEDIYNDNGSLLAEALASGGAIHIMRIPKTPPLLEANSNDISVNMNHARNTILTFFGQQTSEEEAAEAAGITAAPASLQKMRRVARELRDKAYAAKAAKIDSESAAASKAPKDRRRALRRVHTVAQAESARSPLMKKSGGADTASNHSSSEAPESSTPAPLRASAPRRPLVRSKTSTHPPAAHREQVHRPSTISKPNHHLGGNGNTNINSMDISDRMGEHEETIQRLKVQDDDIQKLLQDPKAFAKLQRVLRKHGAVTNEVLRQVLPLYIKSQVHSEAAKTAERRQSERHMEEVLVGGGTIAARTTPPPPPPPPTATATAD